MALIDSVFDTQEAKSLGIGGVPSCLSRVTPTRTPYLWPDLREAHRITVIQRHNQSHIDEAVDTARLSRRGGL